MNALKTTKTQGFSLVEVMIAGAIGIGIFLYINQALIQVQTMQKKIAKSDDVKAIKNFLTANLPHYRAWKNNPKEVPSSTNTSALFYYPTPRSSLETLALHIDIFNESWISAGKEVVECPDKFKNCRVAVFKNNGVHIDTSKIASLKGGQYYLAFIKIETPSGEISRSFVPSFKVFVKDTTKNTQTRAFSKLFHVSPSSSLIKGESVVAHVDDQTVDSIARKDCMVRYREVYPDSLSLGYDLCKKARSAMPAECYIKMRNQKRIKGSIAMIVCAGASNQMAHKCFQEASDVETNDLNRAVLCSAAISLEPLKCARKIIEGIGDARDDKIYKTCSRAQDTTPADCYLGLRAEDKDLLQYAHFLCPHHKN